MELRQFPDQQSSGHCRNPTGGCIKTLILWWRVLVCVGVLQWRFGWACAHPSSLVPFAPKVTFLGKKNLQA